MFSEAAMLPLSGNAVQGVAGRGRVGPAFAETGLPFDDSHAIAG